MLRKAFLALLSMVLFSGCSATPRQNNAPPISDIVLAEILKHKDHGLKFANYEGHGDATKAVYMVDGQNIGTGNQGWEALKYVISRLPAKSCLNIWSYYGGGGFPFIEKDLIDCAKQYGVTIGIPKL